MSVIIRLQNLPWSANAIDIRQYFSGLSIPEGGVHIVGGEFGDAFIAFSTDEDARQAFNRNNGQIKDAQIKLLLSSRTEMQKVIEAARNQSIAALMGTVPSPPVITPSINNITPVITSSPNSYETRKEDKRRRSRSKSRERKERERKRDRRRDRSRSRSRDRRDRRRRDRSRSRERTRSTERDRDRKNILRKNLNDKPILSKEPRVGVWEAPPAPVVADPLLAVAAQNPNILNFVANSLLPNILNRNALDVPNNNFQSRWEPRDSPNNIPNINMPQRDMLYPPQQQLFDDNMMRLNPEPLLQDFRNRPMNNSDYLPNCCIKLFPYYGSYGEIKRFFGGLYIHCNGIKFINDNFGKRTGCIFIRFVYPEGKDEALGRSGDVIRNQTINVEHISDQEFENAIDRYTPENMYPKPSDPEFKEFCCLVIDNLPVYIVEQDVRNMFSDYPLISIALEGRGNTKSAYIKFPSNPEALNAFNETETHVFQGKSVLVEACPEADFERVKKLEIQEQEGTLDPTNVVIIKGLPMKCTDRDIQDYFSDIGVMPAKIKMITDNSGFIGEAVLDFFSIEDAVVAFQKNGMPFGDGIVSMEYEYKIQQPLIPMHMLPNAMPPYTPPMTRPFFPSRNFMQGPRGMRPMGPMPPRGPPMQRRGPPMNQSNENDNENALAPRGCILLMENVPYKANLDEILEFFDGFDVTADNILRKYNPNGLPGGETKIIFNSPDEVAEVMHKKRGARIRDRLIYLTQL